MSYNDPHEVWKRIGDTNYFVSSAGRVMNSKRGNILKPQKKSGGYLKVTLGHKGPQPSIHRLVATAFIDNEDNYETVNHIDENKENNSIENLEWCSQAYNNEYSKAKTYKLISPDGEVVIVYNMNKFCKENNLYQANMSKVVLGVRKSHHGWTLGD